MNDKTFSDCGHVDILVENLFLDTGELIEADGKVRHAVIMRGLKEGKDNRLSVTHKWMEVGYCPICGQELKKNPLQVVNFRLIREVLNERE